KLQEQFANERYSPQHQNDVERESVGVGSGIECEAENQVHCNCKHRQDRNQERAFSPRRPRETANPTLRWWVPFLSLNHPHERIQVYRGGQSGSPGSSKSSSTDLTSPGNSSAQSYQLV